MRALVLALLILACGAGPSAAQDAADPRPAMAERLVAISLVGLDKVLQASITEGLAEAEMEAEHRAWMIANAARIMTPHLETLIQSLTRSYAADFTEAELSALLALYDTPIGREIAAKQLRMSARQEAELMAMQLAYAEDLFSKFCTAFKCDEVGLAPIKPAS